MEYEKNGNDRELRLSRPWCIKMVKSTSDPKGWCNAPVMRCSEMRSAWN
jgi:hypothetical protein